ncbi:MAG: DnaA N-terminal domain-containing protein [Thermotaleaceae bacterium]
MKWPDVLSNISQQLSKSAFNTWFVDTTADFLEDTVIVKTNTDMQAEWLDARYKSLIEKAVKEVTGKEIKVKIETPCQNNLNEHDVVSEEFKERVEKLCKELEPIDKENNHLWQFVERICDYGDDSSLYVKPSTPDEVDTSEVSRFIQAMKKGRREGVEIVISRILKNKPEFSIEEIAQMVEVDVAVVKDIKKEYEKYKGIKVLSDEEVAKNIGRLEVIKSLLESGMSLGEVAKHTPFSLEELERMLSRGF